MRRMAQPALPWCPPGKLRRASRLCCMAQPLRAHAPPRFGRLDAQRNAARNCARVVVRRQAPLGASLARRPLVVAAMARWKFLRRAARAGIADPTTPPAFGTPGCLEAASLDPLSASLPQLRRFVHNALRRQWWRELRRRRRYFGNGPRPRMRWRAGCAPRIRPALRVQAVAGKWAAAGTRILRPGTGDPVSQALVMPSLGRPPRPPQACKRPGARRAVDPCCAGRRGPQEPPGPTALGPNCGALRWPPTGRPSGGARAGRMGHPCGARHIARGHRLPLNRIRGGRGADTPCRPSGVLGPRAATAQVARRYGVLLRAAPTWQRARRRCKMEGVSGR